MDGVEHCYKQWLRNLSCTLTLLHQSLLSYNEANTNIAIKKLYDDDITLVNEDEEVCKNIELNGNYAHVVKNEIKDINEMHVVVHEKEKDIPNEKEMQLLVIEVLSFSVES